MIKDLRIEVDRSGPAEGVLSAFNMALFTAQGDVHDGQALRRWLAEAGMPEPASIPLRTSPGSLVLACAKP